MVIILSKWLSYAPQWCGQSPGGKVGACPLSEYGLQEECLWDGCIFLTPYWQAGSVNVHHCL